MNKQTTQWLRETRAQVAVEVLSDYNKDQSALDGLAAKYVLAAAILELGKFATLAVEVMRE
jgi:hypothetical protein